MRIEIFVVETELQDMRRTQIGKEASIEGYLRLLRCKTDLAKLFKGLTEFGFDKGYYVNNRGKLDADFGKIWLIYTDKPELAEGDRFKAILLEIKDITEQKALAYAINTDLRIMK